MKLYSTVQYTYEEFLEPYMTDWKCYMWYINITIVIIAAFLVSGLLTQSFLRLAIH